MQVVPGTLLAGRYRLVRVLAHGAMGSVWIARHARLDVDVAVKIVSPRHAAAPDALARFEREARAVARIRSPHVVTVHDAGVDDGVAYLVMERLEGEDLDARLRREGRLSLAKTQSMLRQMCKALRRAHEQGVLHRDLKPSNVFLVPDDDGEDLVKLLDFGIAKLVDQGSSDLTTTGMVVGSPPYMSPEQVRGIKHVDHRCDLWSAAVIAFRSVTGALPFDGTVVEVLTRIATQPAPPPSRFAPELAPSIDRFFARAFARDIEARFASARELADAFAEAVESADRERVALADLLEPMPSDVAPDAPRPAPLDAHREEPAVPTAPFAVAAPAEAASPAQARARGRRVAVRVAVAAITAMAAVLVVAIARKAGRPSGEASRPEQPLPLASAAAALPSARAAAAPAGSVPAARPEPIAASAPAGAASAESHADKDAGPVEGAALAEPPTTSEPASSPPPRPKARAGSAERPSSSAPADEHPVLGF